MRDVESRSSLDVVCNILETPNFAASSNLNEVAYS